MANADTTRCPTRGHVVPSVFHHLGIDCEHDMTDEQIAKLVYAADDQDRMDDSNGR